MFNQKGQASSVFNILIAAVVSLAILGLLMGIMGGITFSTSSDPDTVAKNNLKNAISSPYSGQIGDATFSSKKKEINVKNLASVTDIDSSEISLCLDSTLEGSFDKGDGTSLIYSGSKDYSIKIVAYCDSEGKAQQSDLSKYTNGKDLTCGAENKCLIGVYKK